jgi:hypothetical protein
MVTSWKIFDGMKIELCNIICANVQFRVQRQVVDLENRYMNLSMNMEFKYSNHLPLENSKVLSILLAKGWRMGGEQVVLLVNEDIGHVQYVTKTRGAPKGKLPGCNPPKPKFKKHIF